MAALRKKPDTRVFLLSGEEEWYIQYAYKQILKLIGDDTGSGVDTVEGAADTDDLIEMLETAPSMFTSMNVVHLKDTVLFKKQGGSNKKLERFIRYIPSIPEGSLLIMTMHGKPDKRRKLYKTVEKAGLVLESDELKPWNWNDGGWLEDRLRNMGKSFDRNAYTYFTSVIGMMKSISLSLLERELEKLDIYTGSRKKITAEDMRMVMSGIPEVSAFAMLDAIDTHNTAKAEALLLRQVRDGTYLPVLIGLIVRHVRQLAQTRCYMSNGVRGKALATKLKLHPYVAEKVARTAAAFSDDCLRHAMLSLADADYMAKTGRGDIELLEIVILKLCRG